MHTYQTKIKLHETDAAGILFFTQQFKIMHDAYECVLEKIGFSFEELINHQDFFLPIVHAEADYKAPVTVGDLLDVQVRLTDIGESSFTFSYAILNQGGKLVGTGKTVHVTINTTTRQKIPLPPPMRAQIEALYKEDSSS